MPYKWEELSVITGNANDIQKLNTQQRKRCSVKKQVLVSKQFKNLNNHIDFTVYKV